MSLFGDGSRGIFDRGLDLAQVFLCDRAVAGGAGAARNKVQVGIGLPLVPGGQFVELRLRFSQRFEVFGLVFLGLAAGDFFPERRCLYLIFV